jgi:hypothetical protein
MPNTSRLQIPYPSGTTANDVPTHMQNMANALDSLAVDLQGTLAARPAAGVRGRFYTVAGDSSANNGRRFRDDGTTWVELPQLGAWQTWTPTLSGESGSAYTLTVVSIDNKEYRLSNDLCYLSYAATWRFNGGPATSNYGVLLTLPFSAHSTQGVIAADVQNGPGRALIATNQDQLVVYPSDSTWVVDNFTPGRWVRINGFYRILGA